ncbi:Hypothetical predicted protein [Octopus vulgaris]|uniref:Uncharacterized protein n=1 Tax=Octopus vulgaris TaxID=6645 RepID=A0AA36B3V1_OCTVU|nr:Hypothetical predicted protein [Octopus vulgaris]
MQRLRIKAFYKWAQKNHAHLLQPAWAAMDNVSSEITSENFNNMLLAPEFTHLLEIFDEFCKLDQAIVLGVDTTELKIDDESIDAVKQVYLMLYEWFRNCDPETRTHATLSAALEEAECFAAMECLSLEANEERFAIWPHTLYSAMKAQKKDGNNTGYAVHYRENLRSNRIKGAAAILILITQSSLFSSVMEVVNIDCSVEICD